MGYVAYPVLLIALFLFDPSRLPREIIVPVLGFLLVSLFRAAYDAPRPYEVGGKLPPIGKVTKGRSFPSRHTFSMFMIAMAWLWWLPPIGAALLICGCIMAVLRVRLGVHFIRDVVAGALIAIAFGIVGFWIVP